MNRFRMHRLHDDFLAKSTSITGIINTLHTAKNPDHKLVKLFNDTIEDYIEYVKDFQYQTMEAINATEHN